MSTEESAGAVPAETGARKAGVAVPSREPAAPTNFVATVAKLVSMDIVKLSHYWVIIAGYGAMVGISLLGAYLTYHGEQAVKITSGTGYSFAISLVLRCVDLAAPIIYVMICILFAIEVSNSTIKYILTRPVTRLELITSKYITAMLMVTLAIMIFWAIGLYTGWLYYGLGDLVENDYVIFPSSYMYQEMAIGTLFLLIPFATIAAMALMVSTYSSTMGGAIIIGLIGYFFFQILGLVPNTLGLTLHPAVFASAMICLVILLAAMPKLAKRSDWLSQQPLAFVQLGVIGSLGVVYLVAEVFGSALLKLDAINDFLNPGFLQDKGLGTPYFIPWMTIGFPSQRYVPMYILDDLPTGIPIKQWLIQDIRNMIYICTFFFLAFFITSVIGVKRRDFVL